MSRVNRQWTPKARPVAMVEETDFELRSAEIPAPGEGAGAGQEPALLARTRNAPLEPAMRGWMEDRVNYLPPVGIGDVMRGVAIGQVIESNLDGLATGDLVSGMTGWQEYAVGGGMLQKLPEGADPVLALSVLGITGITAYFGLLEVGEPVAGDVVVVSGAAGATGSVVGQIARLKGCRVIGVAGGHEKCAWLTDKAHFDAAIDYKSEDVGERLSELCPDGIDVFFDNVGGTVLDEVLARIAKGARIVICGAITRYSMDALPPGPSNYINLMIQRGRMQGFVILDYAARFPEARAALAEWVADGSITWQADIQKGFENLPKALRRLYTGLNQGKQLLEV